MATQHSRARYPHTVPGDINGLICFSVPGAAVPQGRPRATTVNGHARVYQPKKSMEYQNLVRLAAATEMKGRKPFSGQLRVNISISMAIPASVPKWLRADLEENTEAKPMKKPDLDNVAKAILDGMTGIVYNDDAQVVTLFVRKSYGERDNVWVTVGYNATLQEALEKEHKQNEQRSDL